MSEATCRRNLMEIWAPLHFFFFTINGKIGFSNGLHRILEADWLMVLFPHKGSITHLQNVTINGKCNGALGCLIKNLIVTTVI